MQKKSNDYLNTKKFCEQFGITRSTLGVWLKDGLKDYKSDDDRPAVKRIGVGHGRLRISPAITEEYFFTKGKA